MGMLVGAYCGLQNPVNPGALPVGLTVLGGALIGGLAGSLALRLDLGSTDDGTDGTPDYPTGANQVPAGFVGRVLALFGLLRCWFPFLGLVLNLNGVLVNRGTDDWSWVVSKLGSVVGTLVALVTLVGIILGW